MMGFDVFGGSKQLMRNLTTGKKKKKEKKVKEEKIGKNTSPLTLLSVDHISFLF